MENFSEINKLEKARSKLIELEKKFKELSDDINLTDKEFYEARFPIDAEISKIYDEFPDLEEWNNNRID